MQKVARQALLTARRRGRKAQSGWIEADGNRVHAEFAGVLKLMQLGIECEEDEVWYEIKTRKQPMERAETLIPPDHQLHALRRRY
jgi:hypothetical protein